MGDDESNFPDMSELTPEERARMLNWTERSTVESAPPVPTQIGRYAIVARLDKGGQAETFRAIHPGLQTTVVLKLAHQKADPSLIDRIATEGRLLASLPAHRHLVKVHDVDLHEERVFLVLEDVPGSTLHHYAKDRTPDAKWAAQTVAAIARAIDLAHEQGITHLDLNPRNVLIDREGQPRVIDFGVAWSRPWWVDGDAESSIGGTPSYLSPEQASGQSDRIGRAADVFGLGGILYFLLTGKPLYQGESRLAVLHQAREVAFDRALLERPGIPPRLRDICMKALAKAPGERYATAADLALALERFIAPRRRLHPALLASLFLLSFGLAWGIQTFRHRATQTADLRAQRALDIRIWRPEAPFQPLLQSLPVKAGDEIQIRCRLKSAQEMSIYLVNPLGRMQLLKRFPATAEDREVTYPDLEKSQELKGPAGTELILVLGGPELPEPEEVQRLWDAEGANRPMPSLPATTVARLTANGVAFEGERTRDLGEIRDRSDPQERMRRRLDEFRNRLGQKCAVIEGVAFAHE